MSTHEKLEQQPEEPDGEPPAGQVEQQEEKRGMCGWTKETWAFIYMAISALLFSAQGMCVKFATDKNNGGISSQQMVFVRGSVQIVVVTVAMLIMRVRPCPKNNRKLIGWLSVRALTGAVGFSTYFHTLTCLPLGDAVALVSVYPGISCLIAWCFLGEPLHYLHIFAVVSSFVGTFCIARPTFLFGDSEVEYEIDKSGYYTAAVCCVVGGVIFVIIRKAKAAHTLQLMFCWCVASLAYSSVIGLVVPSLHFIWPNNEILMWSLVASGIATVGHFLFNYAAKIAAAGPASLIRSSDIIYGFILEYFIFHIAPVLTTYIGASLILGAIGAVAGAKFPGMERFVFTRKSAVSNYQEVEANSPSTATTSTLDDAASVELVAIADAGGTNYDMATLHKAFPDLVGEDGLSEA